MTDERDTFVNPPVGDPLTYREWHAFVNGVYVGVTDGTEDHPYETQRHYWRGGYLIGATIREYTTLTPDP